MKLIDLGGVRRIDDQESAIYGTVGYQAPEVAEVGPSVASDIYTIGRTLVVLCMEFRGYQGTYLHTPAAAGRRRRCSQQHDSLYWLIAKCCAPDPADRFASADELRTQLLGVLREVVARTQRRHRAHLGRLGAVRGADAPSRGGRSSGPSCPSCAPTPPTRSTRWLSGVGDEDPAERLEDLEQAPEDSPPRCGWPAARAALELGDVRASPRATPAALLAAGPVGVAGAVDGRPGRDAAAGLGGARRPRSTPSTSRCPASSRPSWRSRSPARRAGCRRSPRGSTPTCAATDATYVAPAAFGMARVRAHRQDAAGRGRRARPGADAPAAATRRAGSCGPRCCSPAARSDLAVLDQAMRSIESVVDGRRPPASATPCGSSSTRSPVVAEATRRRGKGANDRLGTTPPRPASATGLENAPTERWPATPTTSRSGSSWSTRPTPYGAGRLT